MNKVKMERAGETVSRNPYVGQAGVVSCASVASDADTLHWHASIGWFDICAVVTLNDWQGRLVDDGPTFSGRGIASKNAAIAWCKSQADVDTYEVVREDF